MEFIEQLSGSFNTAPLNGEEMIEISGAADEISFDGLDDNDLLLIQTEHSMYTFSIADSALRRGLLIGGQVGEAGATALLIGIDGAETGSPTIYGSKLYVGSRAVFVVSTRGGLPTKLVTSEIKSLTLIKAIVSEPLASQRQLWQVHSNR